mmetsp:Transcript_44011/g.94299  ORF Transcript_44011/g.94299 Transcript_44011/m.94299 type:complete len:105 (+) Transcript_44011:1584-1898(+)
MYVPLNYMPEGRSPGNNKKSGLSARKDGGPRGGQGTRRPIEAPPLLSPHACQLAPPAMFRPTMRQTKRSRAQPSQPIGMVGGLRSKMKIAGPLVSSPRCVASAP